MRFRFPIFMRKIFWVILLLSVFNVLAISLGVTFLQERIWFFSERPRVYMLSDLLFLEGAVIFAVGTFVVSAVSILRIERSSSLYADSGGHTKYLRENREKHLHLGIVLISIGATLMGLSIAISMWIHI